MIFGLWNPSCMTWDFFDLWSYKYKTQKILVNIGSNSEQSKYINKGGQRGGGGHNWEKYFIGLFHVSEHLGHF